MITNILGLVTAICIAASSAIPAKAQPIAPDENKMFKVGDQWIEQCADVDVKSVEGYAAKLNSIKTTYLTDKNKVYYAVIPDKTYYAKDKITSYLNHDAQMASLRPLLPSLTEIDIAPFLTLNDFYYTDGHWRQEKLLPMVDKMGDIMGFKTTSSYEENSFSPYMGTYSARAKEPKADTLFYLTNDITKSAVVENFESDFKEIYDTSKLESKVSYDVFLSGATPLSVITNPKCTTGRELVIFRDSFGGSIAPLMLESYSKVTMIDLRYMKSTLIPQYVTFNDADVLFLMSGRIVNNSMLLK